MESAGSSHLIEIIRAALVPIQPLAAPVQADISAVRGIRVVAFDVYDTLLAQRHDHGQADRRQRESEKEARERLEHCFYRAARDTGLIAPEGADSGAARSRPASYAGSILRRHYQSRIAATRRRLRADGISEPEVDIERIWQQVFAAQEVRDLLLVRPDRDACREVAVRYECLSNPVWPMPDAASVLQQLRESGIRLAIVSNAQFYTPLILSALFNAGPAELGFEPDLCIWSYRLGRAKPDATLFGELLNRLPRCAARSVLCVGNDLENDIAPAASVGCRTCLCAANLGDAAVTGRSVRPDRTITSLSQVINIVVTRRNVCASLSLASSFC